MSISKSRIEKCLETVKAICASPAVAEYLIGRTGQSAQDKGDFYRNLRKNGRADGFDHLVVLADKLTNADAKTLEDRLQAWCGLGKECPPDLDRREVNCRKYHHGKRGRYPSNGNSRRDEHAIYMVWWEK
jgi:hypothetical protein